MKPKHFLALQAKRAALFTQAQNLLAGESPTAEDLATANDILKAQIPAIDAQLATYQALFDAERQAPATASIQVRDRSEDDPKRGFRSMADFAVAVRRASAGGGPNAVDPRLLALYNAEDEGSRVIGAAPTGYMEEAGSVGEGYLVPPEMRAEIWKLVFESEGLLQFLQPEPTGSNSVKFTKDETTPWGSAGVQAYWLDAGEQMTKSKHAHKQAFNQLFRLAAFVLAEDSLEEDAPRLSNLLTAGAAAAINWKSEEACFTGDGVGKPLGWMSSAALVTQSKKSGQAADTIVAENIGAMYARCINPQLASWFASKDSLPQLMVLTIGNQPIWTPPNSGIAGAPGGFLLGRPIKFSRHCEVLGDKGDLQLIDPTGYMLNIKTGGIKYASSIHLYFDFAVNAYRWMFRIGGQPILSAPVAPPKSAPTESHFVTLEART